MKAPSLPMATLAFALWSGSGLACSPQDLSSIPLGYNIDFGTQVQEIFNARCSGCHIGGTSGGLSLSAGSALGNLVNVPSNNAAAGIPRITPGNPAASFLFRKINCTALPGVYGLRMPRNGPPHLTAEQQAVIMDWIREGARAQADPDRIFGGGLEARNNVGPFPL